MKKRSWFWLLCFILAAEAAGLIGSLFVGNISGWYTTLVLPSFNPPGWLFGPVWTILYALMGIAAFLVWQTGERNKVALRLYWIQLAVNALWTPLFFGLHNPTLGLVDIALLLVLIVTTMIFFARIRPVAALLLAPYLGWVSFASILNFAIWYLN